jgi:biopolymer transport protein ExbD
MTFKSYADIAKGRIDPAPMVDVVFLLLIFFVLSSSFVLQPGIKVDLQPSKIIGASQFQGLVVTVTRENLLFFNEQRTTLDGLKKSLQMAAQRGRNQELIIKADRQVPHGTVVELMSMALEAGIPAINIATRPEMAPGQAAGRSE